MTATNIPPNAPSQTNIDLINALNKLTKTVTRVNSAGISSIVSQLAQNTSVIGLLKNSFVQADRLQVKALAQNTNLSKFISENTETLNKMRGSYFDNANELLINFSQGIRDNSDEVTSLMNRMKNTGQSVDTLRSVILALKSVNGGNIESVDRLIKSNGVLESKYLLSAQTLLKAVENNSDLLDIPSLVGSVDGLGVAMAALQANIISRGGTEKQVNAALNLLLGTDSQSFSTRVSLGIQDTLSNLMKPGADAQVVILQAIKKAASVLNTVAVSRGQTDSAQNTSLALEALGNKTSLASILQIDKSMQKQVIASEAMRISSEEQNNSAKTIIGDAQQFYQATVANFYEPVLKYLPLIAAGGIGASLGSVLGNAFGQIVKVLPLVGRLGVFAGPAGLVTGLAATVGPFLYSKFFEPGQKETNKLLDDSVKVQKKILEAQPEKAKSSQALPPTMSSAIGKGVIEYIRMQGNSGKQREENDRLNKTLNDLQRTLDKISNSKFSFR
jgi:hypothetical protein